MGAGLSVDNSKNVSEQLNESTRDVLIEQNVDCASDLTQLADFKAKNSQVDIGGDFVMDQEAALVNSCAQQVTNKQEMFADIAARIAQEADQEKGTDKMFQLAGVTNAENVANVTNALKDNYEAVSGVNCDISLEQVQNVLLEDSNFKVGGDFRVTQKGGLSSDCKQMADLTRKVTDQITADTSQLIVQRVPLGMIGVIVAGIVIVALIGLVGAFIASGSDTADWQPVQQSFSQPMQRRPSLPLTRSGTSPPSTALPPVPGRLNIPQPVPQAVAARTPSMSTAASF